MASSVTLEMRYTECGFAYIGQTRMGFSPVVTTRIPYHNQNALALWAANHWPTPTRQEVEQVIDAVHKAFPDRELVIQTDNGLVSPHRMYWTYRPRNRAHEMPTVGTFYELQQGTKNPRDGEIVWTPFDQYTSLSEARDAQCVLYLNHGRWRILEMKIVWQSESV